MKILCKYKFTNNKEFRVELINAKEIKKRGFNKPDNFVLVFSAKKGKEETALGLRADEVVQLIILLSYGLWAGTQSYTIKALRGYNGFKFN